MPIWLEVILEIIKLTIPALIVFLTVNALLKRFLEGQQQLRLIELRKDQQAATLPLRMQAYERLSLFCERIAIPNLLLRLRKEGMRAGELRLLLLMSIQQEYEHNITQQVYVSDQLWQILNIARDDAVNTVDLAAEMVSPKADAKDMAQALFAILEKRGTTGLEKALLAIKKEASLMLPQ
jgi:hypothetical protein